MRIIKTMAAAMIIALACPNAAQGQGLGDLLGGLLGGGQQNGQTSGGLGDTLGNLIEGVFSSSNITVADMEGEWTASGPAVCFQSEGFLKQAGGKAAAAAVEAKLAPYYEQYGLNNAQLTVNEDGTFTLVTGKLRLNGTITPAAGKEKGVFMFNFTILGQNLMSLTTYVQKTSRSMDVMFDATKFKKLMSSVAQFSGMSLAKAVSSILDSYEGLCIGFNFKGGSTKPDSGSGLGGLLQGLGLGGNGQQGTSGNEKPTGGKGTSAGSGNDSSAGSGLDALRDILTGGSSNSKTKSSNSKTKKK